MTPAQRLEAVDGGATKGKYSLFYRCGYSADQPNGTGNLNGNVPFTTCSYSRSDCEQRGMFTVDTAGRPTGRFGGIEYVPPTILVRGAGQKSSQLSAIQDNTAAYNDFVPLVYGTQWHVPDVVFSRNDGNLTRMEVLLGMVEIQDAMMVLVDDIVIPQGISGVNMTSTGWSTSSAPARATVNRIRISRTGMAICRATRTAAWPSSRLSCRIESTTEQVFPAFRF